MSQNESQVKQAKIVWKAGVLALALVALNGATALPAFQNTFEDITYRSDPSALRAFEYGERHFSSSDPARYDTDRAQHFFELAAKKDSNIPYLYHELARVSFLKGDFHNALGFINAQITLHGDETPNSYYVRGLIEGYMGNYDAAIKDYEHFLHFDPHNWAAINDYAWVLLKADRPRDAVVATAGGLSTFPDNPWLLNTNAIGLYELGLYGPARDQARKALEAAAHLSEGDWLRAYPGNDPRVALEGVAAFQEAVLRNMHSIILALASSTIQSRHE